MSLIAECRSLVEVRSHIDRLDGELLALLAQRAAYVRHAARFKRDANEVAAPQRVEQVVARVLEQAGHYGLAPSVVEATWRAMISAFIAVEQLEHAALQPPSP